MNTELILNYWAAWWILKSVLLLLHVLYMTQELLFYCYIRCTPKTTHMLFITSQEQEVDSG